MQKMNQVIFITAFVGLSVSVNAAVPQWDILPKESTLSFTATQNGSPVSGKFTDFNGEIYFDPAQLPLSKIQIHVDVNSVNASYKELVDTLKTQDWFNVAAFPKASFQSAVFKKVDDKNYESVGNLVIKDKKLPMTVKFTLENYSPTEALIKGDLLLHRTAFGIGQGDWASTDEVKDEVKVQFNFKLKPHS